MPDRAALRRDLRRRRSTLATGARTDAALAIAHHLQPVFLHVRGRRVGGYVAVGGEADPGPALAEARMRGARICLPVLERGNRLRFVTSEAGQELVPNRYGIPEPVAGAVVRAQFLDLVLVPLVGFDDMGNRLGMGAGYYDRGFAFLRHRSTWRRPRLIGVAYDCQRVERLPPAPWDVPLDGVVTEAGLEWFQHTE